MEPGSQAVENHLQLLASHRFGKDYNKILELFARSADETGIAITSHYLSRLTAERSNIRHASVNRGGRQSVQA
jgi:hypothetical protein